MISYEAGLLVLIKYLITHHPPRTHKIRIKIIKTQEILFDRVESKGNALRRIELMVTRPGLSKRLLGPLRGADVVKIKRNAAEVSLEPGCKSWLEEDLDS